MNVRPIVHLCIIAGIVIVEVLASQHAPISVADTEKMTHLHRTHVTIQGLVLQDPDDRGTSMQYVIQAEGWDGKLLIIDRNAVVAALRADTIEASGMFSIPNNEGSIGYGNYLSRLNIVAVVDRATIRVVAQGHPSAFQSFLSSTRHTVKKMIAHLLPEPHSSLLLGLLTGERGSLSPSVQNDFKTDGLTHIIAISGYNITLILSLLSAFLFFLPLRWRLIPLSLGIIVFTLFVGAGASVVRAAIMGIIGLVALHFGRKQDAWTALLLTAFLMLLWNPRELLYDPGFQLSFLSVIGLLEILPFFERLLRWVPKTLGLREALSMTLSAQVTAAPWGMYLFGQVSVIAPVSNLVVAPLVPLASMLGAIAVSIGFVVPPLGKLLALPAWATLSVIVEAAHLFASLPFASLSVTHVPLSLIALYYLVLAMGIWSLGYSTSHSDSA